MRPISFDVAALSLLDAAVDPTQWTRAMDAVAQYAGATGAVLLQLRGRGPGTPHSASLGEGMAEYFRDEWHLRDLRERGIPQLRANGISVDQDYVTPDELKTSDYYNGFLRKYDANWSACIGFSNDDDEWCLVAERGDRKGFFNEREQADLVRFGAYLDRAAQLARQLAYANATGMLDAFEALGCASFLLDHAGQVIRHNPQAERLLGDGLALSRGQLRCERPADSFALGRLTAALGRSAALPPVAVHRVSKRPLVIQGIPLAGLASAIFSPATAILLVSDIDARPPPTAIATTQRMFGLTVMEATVLSFLEQDVPLPAAAEVIGISYETARSHLKRILSKTGASRQAELLMLLGRIHRTGL
jgi:DNA-binding CsgD family transcriptional regulator/PAS domain-containing protein